VKYTAHGKVILLGEHAVVYGHPALAGALADGVTVETAAGSGLLRVPAWGVELDPASLSRAKEGRSLAHAYHALRQTLELGDTSPIDMTVHFAVPAGSGLGSSAAWAVAVARALIAAHGLAESLVAQAAMASETVLHGKPSGLDHTVAERGGFGVFVREAGLTPVKAARPVPLVVGHTGRERDTKGRVQRVAELFAAQRNEVGGRFAEIAQLVAVARNAVEAGNLGTLGEAMSENQRHLQALEVSCPEIERMCRLAVDAGAVGAKLTGGGGGGCVIALAPGRESEVASAWNSAGFKSFTTTVGSGEPSGARRDATPSPRRGGCP
jgi:mevalonate kinase